MSGSEGKAGRSGLELAAGRNLFKPKPEYTDEARAKKIEGQVLLQAIFTASGEVR